MTQNHLLPNYHKNGMWRNYENSSSVSHKNPHFFYAHSVVNYVSWFLFRERKITLLHKHVLMQFLMYQFVLDGSKLKQMQIRRNHLNQKFFRTLYFLIKAWWDISLYMYMIKVIKNIIHKRIMRSCSALYVFALLLASPKYSSIFTRSTLKRRDVS